ncbi:MAG: hypothetical protein ACJ8C4_15650 [Gemmataceae bacterium]
MTQDEFMRMVADEMIRDLTSNAAIKKFADNTDVIGAYAEAGVRRFVERMMAPARVSTGAVISEKLCVNPKQVPQIDAIIWQPMPFIPIFEAGEFALVPSHSVLGILEIKRSCYSSVGAGIAEVIAREADLVAQVEGAQSNKHRKSMGVICVREKDHGEKVLKELIESDKTVVLIDAQDGEIKADHVAVYKLIRFLMGLRSRMCELEGTSVITIK